MIGVLSSERKKVCRILIEVKSNAYVVDEQDHGDCTLPHVYKLAEVVQAVEYLETQKRKNEIKNKNNRER